MRVTLIISALLFIATLVQWNIPLSEGKTMLTYIVPFFFLVTRFVFVLSMLNVSISEKFGPISEAIVCGLGLFIFIMVATKHEYDINWWGFVGDILVSAIVSGMMVFEKHYYVTTTISETIVVRHDEEDK